MKAPQLEENRCSILIAEYATGHVFKRNLTLFLNGDNKSEVFQLFDNFNSAKEFVQNLIKDRPEFECSIFNHSGEHIATYDIGGERKFFNND